MATVYSTTRPLMLLRSALLMTAFWLAGYGIPPVPRGLLPRALPRVCSQGPIRLCPGLSLPRWRVSLHQSTPCGTRARNLRIRSPTPCPLGQGGYCFWQVPRSPIRGGDMAVRSQVSLPSAIQSLSSLSQRPLAIASRVSSHIGDRVLPGPNSCTTPFLTLAFLMCSHVRGRFDSDP